MSTTTASLVGVATFHGYIVEPSTIEVYDLLALARAESPRRATNIRVCYETVQDSLASCVYKGQWNVTVSPRWTCWHFLPAIPENGLSAKIKKRVVLIPPKTLSDTTPPFFVGGVRLPVLGHVHDITCGTRMFFVQISEVEV